MNKKTILFLGAAALASVSYAGEVPITTADWTQITNYVAGDDYTILYNRATSAIAKFGNTSSSGANYDINSITFEVADGSSAPKNWSIYANLSTDVTSKDQTIFTNTTDKFVQYQHGNYTITKGEGATSDASAVIDLNNASLTFKGGYYIQKPTLDVQVNTSIKNGTLEVSSNANVKVSKNSTLSVENLNTSFYSFDKALYPVITVESGSKLSVSGTTTVTADTLMTGSGSYSFNDHIKVSNNANLTIDSTVGDVKFSGDGRIVLDGGSVTIATSNILIDDGKNIRFATTGTTDNHLYVNAATTFTRVYVAGQLNIHLSDDSSAKLVVTQLETITGEGKYIIHDFVDGMIQIENYESIADVNTLFTAYDSSEEPKEVKLAFDSNGWLITASVPEPAEWAAIFGAIALGLAIYRRRK